jgi:hypothetical protein
VRGLTGSQVDGGAGAAMKRATAVLLVDVLCFWCAQGQGRRGKHGLQGGSGRERMRAGARGGERRRGQGWARRNQGGRRMRWWRSAGRCDAAGARRGRRRLCRNARQKDAASKIYTVRRELRFGKQGLLPESGLPTEGEIRLTSRFHNLASKKKR